MVRTASAAILRVIWSGWGITFITFAARMRPRPFRVKFEAEFISGVIACRPVPVPPVQNWFIILRHPMVSRAAFGIKSVFMCSMDIPSFNILAQHWPCAGKWGTGQSRWHI